MKEEIETINLPSGAVATIIEKPKGKHVRKAQNIAGGDNTLIVPALISLCVRINDAQILVEDFDEMPASDALALMGKIGESFL